MVIVSYQSYHYYLYIYFDYKIFQKIYLFHIDYYDFGFTYYRNCYYHIDNNCKLIYFFIFFFMVMECLDVLGCLSVNN